MREGGGEYGLEGEKQADQWCWLCRHENGIFPWQLGKRRLQSQLYWDKLQSLERVEVPSISGSMTELKWRWLKTSEAVKTASLSPTLTTNCPPPRPTPSWVPLLSFTQKSAGIFSGKAKKRKSLWNGLHQVSCHKRNFKRQIYMENWDTASLDRRPHPTLPQASPLPPLTQLAPRMLAARFFLPGWRDSVGSPGDPPLTPIKLVTLKKHTAGCPHCSRVSHELVRPHSLHTSGYKENTRNPEESL